MKCRNFEAIVVELARERGLDEVARSRAMSHAETCPKCAHRLELERELTWALRTLAASALDSPAPPEEEAALLAAFDRRKNAEPARTRACASTGTARHATGSAAPSGGSSGTATAADEGADAARRVRRQVLSVAAHGQQ
jgi:anti-sigma factor RsiW